MCSHALSSDIVPLRTGLVTEERRDSVYIDLDIDQHWSVPARDRRERGA